MSVESKMSGFCPECGSEIRFKKMPQVGQPTHCRQCNIQLEVINRFPLELDWSEPDNTYQFKQKPNRQERRAHGRL